MSPNAPVKKPLRETTLPIPTNEKEINPGGVNETLNAAVAVPPPVPAVAPRSGVLGWFGSSSSMNSGTGSIGAVGERPITDEPKAQVEEATVDEPECPVSDKEAGLLERERQVENREKELEERKLVIDERESELEDRCRELADRERAGKEEEEELQKKIEEVDRKERELEELRREFEEERAKWVEEKDRELKLQNTREWRNAMEALKEEMNLELSAERQKAEERELALERRVMKRVTEILALDKDEQTSKSSAGRGRWDVALKALTR